MTTTEVINTIESATNSLFSVLREQETRIRELENMVERLEANVERLERQLENAHAWGRELTEQRNKASDEVSKLKAEVVTLKTGHQVELDKLTNIVRLINDAIQPVVNPPYVPKPGEQPRDQSGRFRPWSETNPEGYHPGSEPAQAQSNVLHVLSDRVTDPVPVEPPVPAEGPEVDSPLRASGDFRAIA